MIPFVFKDRNEAILFFAALFHDIGKELARSGGEIHEMESVAIIDKIKNHIINNRNIMYATEESKVNRITEQDIEDIKFLIMHHHYKLRKLHESYSMREDLHELLDILRDADAISASEQRVNPIIYTSDKKLFLFEEYAKISGDCPNFSEYGHKMIKITKYLNPHIDFPYIFDENELNKIDRFNPWEYSEPERINYYEPPKMTALFKTMSGLKTNITIPDIIYLLDEFFSFLPAATYKSIPDVSLAMHLKMTAAIALSIYRSKRNNREIKLILGDISGIQKFIFSVPQKNANKLLIAKSTYINLLTKIIPKYMCNVLDVPETNIVFSTGGRFLIIADSNEQTTKKIENIATEIEKHMLDAHNGTLDVILSQQNTILSKEKESWKRCIEELEYNVARQKRNKFKNQLEALFEIHDIPLNKDAGYAECQSCGKITENTKTEDSHLCTLCSSLIDITNTLKKIQLNANRNNTYLYTKYTESYDSVKWSKVFNRLGIEIGFTSEHKNDYKIYRTTPTIQKENRSEKFIQLIALPSHMPISGNEIKSFERLYEENNSLTLLKMDVDNLGRIFKWGFGKYTTPSQTATLSRLFSWFFEVRLPEIIREKGQDNAYLIYSTGDDVFILGGLDALINIAKEVESEFQEFTGNNPSITLSFILQEFNPHTKLINVADMARDLLEETKEHIKLMSPDKNPNKYEKYKKIINEAITSIYKNKYVSLDLDGNSYMTISNTISYMNNKKSKANIFGITLPITMRPRNNIIFECNFDKSYINRDLIFSNATSAIQIGNFLSKEILEGKLSRSTLFKISEIANSYKESLKGNRLVKVWIFEYIILRQIQNEDIRNKMKTSIGFWLDLESENNESEQDFVKRINLGSNICLLASRYAELKTRNMEEIQNVPG